MSTAAVTAVDRVSLALFLSLAAHALVILGVGFSGLPDMRERSAPMIEVTLADRPQDETPEDYDFLAQASQDGGGESQAAEVPEKPTEAFMPGVPEGASPLQAAPAPGAERRPDPRESVAGADDPQRRQAQPQRESPADAGRPEPLNAERQLAAASELSAAAERIAARYPSKRRINARTRAHDAAEYMRQWVNRVERIGNLNYPREVRARNLSGRVIMEVTLRPDGGVHAARVLRSSGEPALDQAAQRIVDLAGPFERVPEAVLADNDLLVITRTWAFEDGQRFTSR